jgi:hypothetical protein
VKHEIFGRNNNLQASVDSTDNVLSFLLSVAFLPQIASFFSAILLRRIHNSRMSKHDTFFCRLNVDALTLVHRLQWKVVSVEFLRRTFFGEKNEF